MQATAQTRLVTSVANTAQLPQPEQQETQPDQDAGQAKEADLPIAHANGLLENAPPAPGAEKRQQALDHQHQRTCAQQGIPHEGWTDETVVLIGPDTCLRAGASTARPA